MASPFNSFRKNKKVWFAFLTVVAMVTFVLAPSTVRVGCSRSQSEDYAVQTKSHSLTTHELQSLVRLRDRTNQFAAHLESKRAAAAAQEKAPQQQPRQTSFGGDSLRDVFDTWLKAQKARDLGISVSHDAITDYIKAQSGGSLSTQEMQQFLRQHEMSEVALYGALENELLAQRVDELYGFGRTARMELTPAQRKEVWDREHRRAHAEAVPLPVADLARLMPEPPEAELKAFFEKGRNQLPDPDLPTFGFKLPYLARFQDVRVSQARLYEAAMAAITPEEISLRYEEEKGKKIPAAFMSFDEKAWRESLPSQEKASPGEKKEPGKAAAKPGAEKPATEKVQSDAKSGGGASIAPPNRAHREASASRAYPISVAADENHGRESELLLAQADPAKTSEKSSSAAKTTDAKTTDAKTPDVKTGAAKSDVAESAPAAKQPGKSKESSPAEGSSSTTGPFKQRPPELNQILNDFTIPEDIRELQPGKKPPEFKALWQVESTIRETLAKEMAERDGKQLLESIKKPLDDYGAKYHKWEDKKKTEKPANPLESEASARKLIDDAWTKLVEAKKTAWKTSFEERKKVVDEKVRAIMEEKQQKTLDGFKKLAAVSKNDVWERLLKEHQQLADVEKLISETLSTWEKPLTAKRIDLEGTTGSTAPAKKAEAAKGSDAGDKKEKLGDSKQENPKKAEAEKSAAEKTAPAKSEPAKGEPVKSEPGKTEPAKSEPTEAVISLETTGRGRDKDGREEIGLDQRDFFRHVPKYALANVTLEGDKSFINDAFGPGQLFLPQLGVGRDDRGNVDSQFLFWRVAERPATTLNWDESETKKVVLEKYREDEARGLALRVAEQLSLYQAPKGNEFPVEEVERLFRLDPYETTPTPAELRESDRKDLSFTGLESQPAYAVVAEVFADGKRSTLNLPSAPRQGPLEAPAPGDTSGHPWVFADVEEARKFAVHLATTEHKPQVLVIVGKSIGVVGGQPVFQGIQAFRWGQAEKSVPGVKEVRYGDENYKVTIEASHDDAKDVISGPGRLAGHTFTVSVESGNKTATLKLTGERLGPFTWDQLPDRGDDPAVSGLVVPGEAFGDTVFKLAPGELGVALNQPRSIAYVVQVTGYDYSFGRSIYPVDTTLEKNPLYDRFVAGFRDAPAAQRRFNQEAQQYQQEVAQYPARVRQYQQLVALSPDLAARFGGPPVPPTRPVPPRSVIYHAQRTQQERDAWLGALYREYGVPIEQVSRLTERTSRE